MHNPALGTVVIIVSESDIGGDSLMARYWARVTTIHQRATLYVVGTNDNGGLFDDDFGYSDQTTISLNRDLGSISRDARDVARSACPNPPSSPSMYLSFCFKC